MKSTRKIYRPLTGAKHEMPARVLELCELHTQPFAVVAAWVDIPGDNAQRGHRGRYTPAWKLTLRDDFKNSLTFSDGRTKADYPFDNPIVHITAWVWSVGDDNAKAGRFKYPIDMLQPKTVSSQGKETGLLGLISNDRILKLGQNLFIEELGNRKKDTNGYVKLGIEIIVFEGSI